MKFFRNIRNKFNLEAYFYLIPALIFLSLFIILPILLLFFISFFRWDMFSGSLTFAGLKNYLKLFSDSGFFTAFKNTLIYVGGTVPLGMAGGLLLAVLLNNKLKLKSFYRTAVFSPVIVSLAASGIIWSWIYDYHNGILNHLLVTMGLSKINWLGNPDMSLLSIIMVTLWKRIGYNMVIFLAGLSVIPNQLYEAAKIDGAKAINQFRYVTWSNLIPTTVFVLVINLIFAFRDFAQFYVMTRGGPLESSTTLVYYIYETAFSEFNVGYAAAVAMVLFLIVIIITYIQINSFSESTKGESA